MSQHLLAMLLHLLLLKVMVPPVEGMVRDIVVVALAEIEDKLVNAPTVARIGIVRKCVGNSMVVRLRLRMLLYLTLDAFLLLLS